jgi:ATP synthase protein I
MTGDDQDQQRLNKLRSELDARKAHDNRDKDNDGTSNPHGSRDPDNMRRGMLAGTEFVGAIIVGGLIGYVLDTLIGIWPVFFLIWLLLGIMTGFYNIYRITNNMSIEGPFQPLHQREKNDMTQSKNDDDNN